MGSGLAPDAREAASAPRPPAARLVRWIVRFVALAMVGAVLIPAFGGVTPTFSVTVSCDAVTVGVSSLCTATVSTTGGGSGFPIRVGAYDNEQGGQPTQAEAVERARQFDVITAGPYQYKHYVGAMRAANPDLVLNTYMNGTHTRNSDRSESQYCHDASGARITTTGIWKTSFLMNPANAGWRNTVVAQVNAAITESGYNGVFLDTLGRGALQYNVTGRCIDTSTGQGYTPGDWEQDTGALAAYVQTQTSRSAVGNGVDRGTNYFGVPPSSVIARSIAGGLAEGFTRNGAFYEGFYSESAIVKDVQMVADGPVVHVLAKDWRDVSAASKDQEMRYAFAAFLLGTDGNDVFGWTGSKSAFTQFHPLWDVDLGSPSGESYALGSGRYRRDFARGHVVLDTVAHTGYVGTDGAQAPSVAWSSSGDGTFGASSCRAVDLSTTVCETRYTPSATGAQTITATGTVPPSPVQVVATTSVQVAKRGTTTTVACTSPVTVPDASTCTATVTDVDGGNASAPTGGVTFSTNGPGSFGAASCDLAAGTGATSSCSVAYSPSVAGIHEVSAEYGADPVHRQSATQAPAVVVAEAVEAPSDPPSDPPTDPPTDPPGDTVAPTVEVTSPLDGATVVRGRPVTIQVSAGDDVGVTKVVVSVNGSVVCTLPAPGWTCTWTAPKAPGKRIELTATAFDAAGNTATDRVTITTVRR